MGKRIRQWRDKLFGKRSNELLVFCFFLAVSFGFWFLQALNETLEREMQIRLELENVPSDVVIIDSLPPSIGVTLHDRGLILARQNISNIFRPKRVKIDFTKYDTGKSDAEIYISTSDIAFPTIMASREPFPSSSSEPSRLRDRTTSKAFSSNQKPSRSLLRKQSSTPCTPFIPMHSTSRN